MSDFIAPERRVSGIPMTGIQYIPGHKEDFIDYVIDNYLPDDGIVDLAGGGLRFALAAAEKKRSIIVVDIDPGSLNIKEIAKQVNRNQKVMIPSYASDFIYPVISDVRDFLNYTNERFKLITAFRLIHFFSPEEIDDFFTIINSRLTDGGIFALSAITPYIFNDVISLNELYISSSPIIEDKPLYREFDLSEESKRVMFEQNLSPRVHFINEAFINMLAQKHGYRILDKNCIATRVVNGFVLKKL